MLRLASASPRRMELLRLLGVLYEAVPAAIDERAHVSPAAAKADAVARPGAVTLAADTEIEIEGERVGKPGDPSTAVTMLADLAGQTHDVRTEVALVGADGRRMRFVVRSRVTLRELTLREIERYVATGEALDKAGGYAIQGAGRRLVESYDGCLANVTGLPLCHVYFALRRVGVVPPHRPEIVCQERFDFTCTVWRTAQRQGRALHDHDEYRTWTEDIRTDER